MVSFHKFVSSDFQGETLGCQIDSAKTFFSPQNRKYSSESCLLVQYSKKSMVQLHPLHHPNAAPEKFRKCVIQVENVI